MILQNVFQGLDQKVIVSIRYQLEAMCNIIMKLSYLLILL